VSAIGYSLVPTMRPDLLFMSSLRGALATKQSSLPVVQWIASLRSQ